MEIVQTHFKYTTPLTPLRLDKIQYIVVHHADAVTASPEQIHQWHLDRGWSGFGYNEYIRKDGTVYIGRGDFVGAQCYGYNATSYGICCEGNYQTEKSAPPSLLDSLEARLKYHKQRFVSLRKIVRHGELVATECPGPYFPFQRLLTALEAPAPPHWAKKDQDELLASGILEQDHTATLNSTATEGFVIALVNRLRKDGWKA